MVNADTTESTHKGAPVSRRDQDMEELLKRRDEEKLDVDELNEEDLDEGEDEGILEDEDNDALEDLKDDPPKTMVFKGADGEEYTVPLDASATFKIDGEEVSAPVNQITQRYQKGAAGDMRLREASNLKKTLEQREATLTAKEAEFLDRMNTAQQQQTTGDLSSDDYKVKVRELIEAVVEADEERAVELFSSVITPPKDNTAQITASITADVKKELTARETAKEQKRYNAKLVKANARFKEEDKDLASDTYLFDIVDNETVKISNEDPTAEPWDVISRAAERVKKWHGRFKTTSKKSLKRSTPTPAGGRAKLGDDEKPAPTRRDTLNEMRAARGQPAL